MRVEVLLVGLGIVGAGCNGGGEGGCPSRAMTTISRQPNVPFGGLVPCPTGGGNAFKPEDSTGILPWKPGDTPTTEWCRVLCFIGCGPNCPSESRDGGEVLISCRIADSAEPLPPTCAPSEVLCTEERPNLCPL